MISSQAASCRSGEPGALAPLTRYGCVTRATAAPAASPARRAAKMSLVATPPPAPCVSTSRNRGAAGASSSARAGPAPVRICMARGYVFYPRSRRACTPAARYRTECGRGHRTALGDQEFLREVQYASEGNLAARQSIYAFSEPKLDLPALVLDSLQLTGSEFVLDVGCGNGIYLAELARRGQHARVLGVDLSPGMLTAARDRSPAAHVVAGDAASLPLRSAASQVTLAMHMLHHVPRPARAAAELRSRSPAAGRSPWPTPTPAIPPGSSGPVASAPAAAGSAQSPQPRSPTPPAGALRPPPCGYNSSGPPLV
jgi:hypothetical protein